METAATGPRPRSDADCAASRQSIAQTTVAADAATDGSVRRSATAIASEGVARDRSSSRYRWTSSRA